jgi:hypothetical protein
VDLCFCLRARALRPRGPPAHGSGRVGADGRPLRRRARLAAPAQLPVQPYLGLPRRPGLASLASYGSGRKRRKPASQATNRIPGDRSSRRDQSRRCLSRRGRVSRGRLLESTARRTRSVVIRRAGREGTGLSIGSPGYSQEPGWTFRVVLTRLKKLVSAIIETSADRARSSNRSAASAQISSVTMSG